MLQPNHAHSGASEPALAALLTVREALAALDELRVTDPYALAALFDFLRAEWKGQGAIDYSPAAIEAIRQRSLKLKLDVINSSAEGQLSAAVGA